jgi:sugar phosphate isomerase/epimerase
MQSSLSRRRFLALSAAAAGGATFFDAPRILRAANLADEKDKYGGFPMGIQTYTLRNFNLADTLRHIAGLGLHYAEFFSSHLAVNADDATIKSLHADLDRAKIKIVAHGVNAFSKNHDANRKLFEFAKRVGFKTLTADPSPDSFDSLDKLCEEYQIRIAIHNHGPGNRYAKLENVKKAVKDRHKLIGSCVDTGHALRSDEDPVKWVAELGPRVFGVHIKDVKEKKDRTYDVIIGSGHLDLVELFKTLRKIKFPADGAMSLEYEANPQNPIDDVSKCLAKAAEAIAKIG